MNSRIAKICFLLFLMLVTVSNIVTSYETYVVVRAVRVIILILVTIGFVIYVRSLNSGFVLYLYLFLVYVLSILIYENDPIYIIDFVVLLLGIPFVSFVLKHYSQKDELQYIFSLLIFFYCSISLTLFLDGFNLDGAFLFNLAYQSEEFGDSSGYSLGLSNIYGLFTVIFLYRYLANGSNRMLYAVSAILAAALTFLGGGRGEIMAVLVTIIFTMSYWILSAKQKSLPGVAFFASVVVVLFSFSFYSLIEYSLTVSRFVTLFDGNFSSRDMLLLQGFKLLSDNVNCLIFGCGVGFFQNYFGYDLSMYPHNFIMEFIISFGLFAFIFVFVFLMIGLHKHHRSFGQLSLISIIVFYQFLIALKSGYVVGTHLLMVLIICFFSLGLSKGAKHA